MQAYEELKAVVEESESRKRKLNNAIKENKSLLIKLNQDHKTAVLTDNNKEADRLFSEIEKAERTIKSSKRKLSVIDQEDTNQNVDEAAERVYQEAVEEIRSLQQQADKKREEVEAAEEAFYDKLRELGDIKRSALPIINKVNDAASHSPALPQKHKGRFNPWGGYFGSVSIRGFEDISANKMQKVMDERPKQEA